MSDRYGCPSCHVPTADEALCRPCTADLVRDLQAVPELAAELEVWRAKLDRMGGHTPGGSMESPLGYRPMAVEVADVLHLTLATWARPVASAAGVPLAEVPAEGPAELATWLHLHVERVRHLADSGLLVDEVHYAVRTVRRAIDRPGERRYAGPCDQCGADLYAQPHGSTVDCRGCGALYDVRARREWLLDGLREHSATAAEIAQGIGELHGVPVNRKAINLWHHRKRLECVGHTRTGAPLFRIGDVLDLAAKSAARATA